MAKTAVERTGLIVGVQPTRGHQTKTRALPRKPVNRKGKSSKSRLLVKGVIREVAGFAPFERRLMEQLRNSLDKRARKYAKKRLGTMKRGKAKIEELSNIIAEQRRTAAH